MKKPIQISIPTPCHENWDAMTSADKGRFCASCQKNVIDFTKSSDREIASVLKNTENACGRLRAAQLDRDLVIPKEKSSFWMAASAAVVSFLTIGNHEVSAQTPVNTEQHVSETDEIIGKVALPQKMIINGIVTDSINLPVYGANVIIKGTKQGVQTDIDGKFSIEVNTGETIQVSYIGMLTQQITISESNHIKIIMQEDTVNISSGIIITAYKRTFFGQIFHSIGNVFRKNDK